MTYHGTGTIKKYQENNLEIHQWDVVRIEIGVLMRLFCDS